MRQKVFVFKCWFYIIRQFASLGECPVYPIYREYSLSWYDKKALS